MREVDGFFLFELGQITLLSALPHNVDLRPNNEVITDIRKHLREFAETKANREDLPDAVTIADEIVKVLTAVLEKNPFPSITPAEHVSLVYQVMLFRDRLARNLGKIYSQVLEDKGGRSVKTLWTNPLTLLPLRIVLELSDFTCANIKEAAKAWVVDRPTATGFHMMRSVECVLRQYKKLVTGKDLQWNDKKGTLRYDGFGTIVNDLAAYLEPLKRNNQPYGQLEFVIGLLRPLSKLYRDPIAHPELKELDEEDAKLAFEQGLSVIGRMVQDALDDGAHFTKAFVSGTKF
jgi:hypothetical protein